MILVTGAAGKTGQAVIRALVRKGAAVRAFVHRQEHAPLVRALGVNDVVVGDLRDPRAMAQASTGVRAVYHICPSVHPEEAAIGQVAIEAARAGGVEQFVYHSAMFPQIDALPHHVQKLRVETALIQSELPFTILEPASYMQNIMESWEHIEQQGVYATLYGLDAHLSLVDLDDVGEVAALVLTEPGHLAAVYQLSGPEVLTPVKMAAILADKLGRPVIAMSPPHEEWEQHMREAGMSDYRVTALDTMFRYYARHGFVGNPNILTCLLRRPPTTFAAFVERMRQ